MLQRVDFHNQEGAQRAWKMGREGTQGLLQRVSETEDKALFRPLGQVRPKASVSPSPKDPDANPKTTDR